VFGKSPPKKGVLAEVMFGEVTEDGGEAPHAEELGKGDVNVDVDAIVDGR
jgi:hypothetical protein